MCQQGRRARMKPLSFLEEAVAYVTLGLLCGWYYLLMAAGVPLFVCAINGSTIAIAVIAALVVDIFIPLHYKPWVCFNRSTVFAIWRKYFEFEYDASETVLEQGKKYLFCEFPHGVFPLAQFISASIVHDIFPAQVLCGVGADVIFMVPVLRHVMSWIGMRPATRKNISAIFNEGCQCVVLPGGIAEMFLVSPKYEQVYLRKRYGTVKAAIQEGAALVPVIFFGNSSLFDVVGADPSSWLAVLSRKLRASIVLFYGRHYLPVPYRRKLKMVGGSPIPVQQCEKPSNEQVEETLAKLVSALEQLYKTHRPEWEHRDLKVL